MNDYKYFTARISLGFLSEQRRKWSLDAGFLHRLFGLANRWLIAVPVVFPFGADRMSDREFVGQSECPWETHGNDTSI